MASYIVRGGPGSYEFPGVVMYLEREEDRKRWEFSDGEEELEDAEEEEPTKKPASPQRDAMAQNRRRLEEFANVVDDDGASSASSSVPLDPATQVPVFLLPQELNFVLGDAPDTRKVLSIYNPYDDPFTFRLLCTDPEHYNISRSGGTIGPKCVMDVAIRGRPSLKPTMIHRLKVEIRKLGAHELMGSRIINMRALAHAPPPNDESSFQRMPRRGLEESPANARVVIDNQPVAQAAVSTPLVLFVCGLCALTLCLPVVRDPTAKPESLIPSYLHITDTQRVVAAYILGLCTMLMLAPPAAAAPQPNRRP